MPNVAKTNVAFPEGYSTSFRKYHTINFPATKQVRYYFANAKAIDAAKSGKALPDGSYLFAEVHSAKLDADGKPVTGPDGFYVPDKLLLYTAMQRDAGWGKDMGVQAVLQLVVMACGILVQLFSGYTKFELGQYVYRLFALQLPEFWMIAALALTIHSVVDNKYLGHFLVILYYVVSIMPRSSSQNVSSQPLGPNQRLSRSGSVHARNTRSRGALKARRMIRTGGSSVDSTCICVL